MIHPATAKTPGEPYVYSIPNKSPHGAIHS